MNEIVERPISARAKDIAKRVFRYENTVLSLVLIGLVGVLGVLTGGKAVSVSNLRNVLVQSSARGMASIGQAFVILTAGIDLAPTGLALLSTCVGGWLISEGSFGALAKGPEWPLSLGLLVVVLIGFGVGAVNGSLVSRVGMPALIVTLGMWQITRGAALRVTQGWNISGLPEGLAFLGQGNIAGVPVPVIIFFVSIAIAYFVLNHTSFGRSVYAVGGNPVSAWLSGVNVKNTQFIVYVISGFTAALAGIILTARAMTASLFVASNLELDSIASVVIGGVSLFGGRGSLIGVLIGVMIIGVINNGLNLLGVPHGMTDMVRGGVIVIAVAIDVLRRRRG